MATPSSNTYSQGFYRMPEFYQQQLLGLGQHVQLPTRQTRPSNRALVCATSSRSSVATEFKQTFNLKEKAGKELTTALMSQRQHVEQANSELLSISQQIRVLEMEKSAIEVSLLNSNECLAKAETHRDAWETDWTTETSFLASLTWFQLKNPDCPLAQLEATDISIALGVDSLDDLIDTYTRDQQIEILQFLHNLGWSESTLVRGHTIHSEMVCQPTQIQIQIQIEHA
jgi:hypothetical protein